ncbi:MAG: hypothetical protein IPK89_07070 [Sphingomonadales bacterium]|nr:hypothetical protein [Sphingomonadales bacterium]
MIELFFWPTPNGYKATVLWRNWDCLQITPINILAGEQFDPAFLKISQTTRFPPSSITMVQMASRLRYSDLAPYCSTWLKRPESFFPSLK